MDHVQTKGARTMDVADITSLKDELDSLWIRYMDAVDNYQASIASISKHMSTGFFSLAQANRRSTSRQRYGQDFYDQRMKAFRQCKVSIDEHDRPLLAIDHNTRTISSTKKAEDEPSQQPSPPATPEPGVDAREKCQDEGNGSDYASPDNSDKTSSPSISPEAARDPLRWFGLLTPPELRKTQSHFISSMDNDLATATNSSRYLRSLEVEIRRLRKGIKKAEKKDT